MLYLVAYDLLRDETEDHYERVIDALKCNGTAIEIQRSVWFLASRSEAVDIRHSIRLELDEGDKLFVTELTSSNCGFVNLQQRAREWMSQAGLL